MKNTTGGKQVHVFNVPNNAEGKAQIATFRRLIRNSKTRQQIILYGRGHRYGLGRSKWVNGQFIHGNDYQSHVPMAKAQTIAVYIRSGHWSSAQR